MTFSPTNAALEGFRLTRREPALLAGIALAYAAVTALVLVIDPQSVRSLLTLLQSFTPGVAVPEEDQLALVNLYSRLGGILALPALIMSVICQTAVGRAVLRPSSSPWSYFKPGRDHVHVLILSVLVWMLFLAASTVGFLIVGLLFGFSTVAGPILAVLGVLGTIAMVVALVWLAVKVSLALPLTIDRNRVSLRTSFKETKGVFWPLLGMAVMANLLTLAVSILISLVSAPVLTLTGGLVPFTESPNITVAVVIGAAVWTLIMSVSSAAQLLILYAPFPAAWKQMSGR